MPRCALLGEISATKPLQLALAMSLCWTVIFVTVDERRNRPMNG
jgi:hypothetical protein